MTCTCRNVTIKNDLSLPEGIAMPAHSEYLGKSIRSNNHQAFLCEAFRLVILLLTYSSVLCPKVLARACFSFIFYLILFNTSNLMDLLPFQITETDYNIQGTAEK